MPTKSLIAKRLTLRWSRAALVTSVTTSTPAARAISSIGKTDPSSIRGGSTVGMVGGLTPTVTNGSTTDRSGRWLVPLTSAGNTDIRRDAVLICKYLGMLAAGVLALAACQPAAGDPPVLTNAKPIVVGQAGNPTGFRGGVLVGLGPELSIGQRVSNWRWELPKAAADGFEASIGFTSEVLDANCENFPAHFDCPLPDETVLRFHLSALYDLDRRVSFRQAAASSDRVEVYRSGTDLQHVSIAASVPQSDIGTHCLLIAALEDDPTIAEGQFADHSGTGVWTIVVEGDGPVHCDAPAYSGPWWPVDADGPIAGDCALPWLTDQPQLYAQGMDSTSANLWAVLPRCGPPGESYAVFAVDGVLQGGKDVLSPYRIPATDAPGIVVTVNDPGGWLRVLVATFPQDGERPRLLTSRPWPPIELSR